MLRPRHCPVVSAGGALQRAALQLARLPVVWPAGHGIRGPVCLQECPAGCGSQASRQFADEIGWDWSRLACALLTSTTSRPAVSAFSTMILQNNGGCAIFADSILIKVVWPTAVHEIREASVAPRVETVIA